MHPADVIPPGQSMAIAQAPHAKVRIRRPPVARQANRTALAFHFLMALLCQAGFTLPLLNPSRTGLAINPASRWFIWAGFILYVFVQKQRSHTTLRQTLVSVCFGVYVIVTIVSSMLNTELLADGAFRSVALVGLYLLAFLAYAGHDWREIVQVWTTAWGLLAACVCTWSTVLLFRASSYQGGRFYGIFLEPNHLAHYSAVLFILLFVISLHTHHHVRWLFIFLTPIPLLCLYTSGSRANMIGACFASLLVLATSRGRALAIVFFLCATGVWGLSLIPDLPVRIMQRSISSFSSLDNRQIVLENQWAVFQTSPFVGNGLGGGNVNTFDEAIGNHRAGGESSYGDIMTIAGLAGSLPLFLGMAIALQRLRRLAKRRDADAIIKAAFFIIVTIMVVSIGEAWLATIGTVPVQFVWLILGAAARSGKAGRQPGRLWRVTRFAPMTYVAPRSA